MYPKTVPNRWKQYLAAQTCLGNYELNKSLKGENCANSIISTKGRDLFNLQFYKHGYNSGLGENSFLVWRNCTLANKGNSKLKNSYLNDLVLL